MTSLALLDFAKTLSGHYSNHEQSQNYPRYFAHIHTYFRPIPSNIFKGPGFYSEQSYDFLPWSPYRQSIHRLSIKNNIFILESYSIKEPDRLAGAGFNVDFLKNISTENLSKRSGCSMHFMEGNNGEYHGKVEPGNCCMVQRGGEMTYLTSQVFLGRDELITLDRGYSKDSGEQIWGSKYGALKFKKSKE